MTDAETGKPRGFAFVEFEDPQAALSAIRNMNDYELNGRRLRVNFSNSSHLEALAGKLGMDLSAQTQQRSSSNNNNTGTSQVNSSSTNQQGNLSHPDVGMQSAAAAGTQLVADALKGMSKGEMYDVIAKLKEISDRDPDEARRVIAGHPQLPEAILFLMSKLDMVKDNPNAAMMEAAVVPAAPAVVVDPRSRAVDPRARVDPRAAAAATTSDPRAAAVPPPAPAAAAAAPPAPPRADPRARLDPRARAAAPPPPPMMMSQPPPPPPSFPPPPPSQPGVANLDPALVQQVMSLTPHQISQLPPDKQQSIMALRNQISGGR